MGRPELRRLPRQHLLVYPPRLRPLPHLVQQDRQVALGRQSVVVGRSKLRRLLLVHPPRLRPLPPLLQHDR